MSGGFGRHISAFATVQYRRLGVSEDAAHAQRRDARVGISRRFGAEGGKAHRFGKISAVRPFFPPPIGGLKLRSRFCGIIFFLGGGNRTFNGTEKKRANRPFFAPSAAAFYGRARQLTRGRIRIQIPASKCAAPHNGLQRPMHASRLPVWRSMRRQVHLGVFLVAFAVYCHVGL